MEARNLLAVLGVTTNSDVVNENDGVMSLREALNMANSTPGVDTITLPESLPVGTITLTRGELTITDAVTIEGPGANLLTIDANGKSRIFLVDDQDSENEIEVVISGLTLTGGRATDGEVTITDQDYGGAIFTREELHLTNSTLSGNSASEDGGGISNEGTLTVSNSTLSSNTASFGGGIDNKATLTVTNSTLSGNLADDFGGGIYNESQSTLTVTNSTLSGNTAGPSLVGVGGGIYNGSESTLKVTDSTLSSNKAGDIGGGIYNGGKLTVTDSTLSGNTAGTTDGGGIYNHSQGMLTVTKSKLSSNTAGKDGGGIYNGGTLTVTNSTLSGNTAGPSLVGRGGGIYQQDGGTLTVTDSTLSSNKAGDVGGGIYNGGKLTVTDSTLSGNTAGTDGGGIYNHSQSVLTLTKSTLRINKAGEDGGGIFNFSQSMLTVTESKLSGNSAGKNGGGIDNGGKLTVTDSTLSGNTAGSNGVGGGIHNSTLVSTLTVTNSTLSGNSAVQFGGGIFNRGTLTVTNSTLSGNSVGKNGFGGGIDNRNKLTVTNSTLSGNTAQALGGGIFTNGTLTVTNSTLSGNSAVQFGGGIYNNGPLTVTNSTLSGNSAGSNGFGGGGIYNNNGTLTVTNTLVAGNQLTDGKASDLEGTNVVSTSSFNLIGDPNTAGGLTNDSRGNIVLENADAWKTVLANDGTNPTLASNNGPTQTIALLAGSPALNKGNNALATEDGTASGKALSTDQRGAPFVRIFNDTVDIGAYERQTVSADLLHVTTLTDELDFNNDDVSLREAIYSAKMYFPGATVDVITFAESLHGDTITLTQGELKIADAVKIEGPGAKLLTINANDNSSIFLVDDGASGNETEVEISGLTLTGGKATDGDDTQFTDRDLGGAIFSREKLHLTNSTLSGNSAGKDGGGISNHGTLTVTNSTLSGNSAGNDGGGISNHGTLTVTNSTLSGNSAGSNGFGGGIHNSTVGLSTLTVTNSTLSSNTANDGGGIYNAATLTVTNSTLSGNAASKDGGGISNAATLTVTNSTLSGNSASKDGGGISNLSQSMLTVTNSTLSGNSAGNEGGGIANHGTLTVTNSTLSSNTANHGGGIDNEATLTVTNSTLSGNSASEDGGGIYNFSRRALTLTNTIVAGNQLTDGKASDLAGVNVVSTSSFNLIGDPNTAGGLTNDSRGNIVLENADAWKTVLANDGTNPTLASNSGPTQTIALLAGSAALDKGNNALATEDGTASGKALSTDQRGAPFVRIFNGTVDIGAYEAGNGFTVDVPSTGQVEVTSEGADLVVKAGSMELFRRPVNMVTELLLRGTDGNDVFDVAELPPNIVLRIDGGMGDDDTLRLIGAGQKLDLLAGNFQSLEKVDITGSGKNRIELSPAKVRAASPVTETLTVISNEDDEVKVGEGWKISSTESKDGRLVKILTSNPTLRLVGPSDWTNPIDPLDVNADGEVAPSDVLAVINEVNAPQYSGVNGQLLNAAELAEFPNIYLDPNHDGFVAASDALLLINFINSLNNPAGSPEGESKPLRFDPNLTSVPASVVRRAALGVQLEEEADVSLRGRQQLIEAVFFDSAHLGPPAGYSTQDNRTAATNESEPADAIDALFRAFASVNDDSEWWL